MENGNIMTKHLASTGISIVLALATFAEAPTPSIATSLPDKSFDLAGKRMTSPQFFRMESKLVVHALDGKRLGTDVYRLHLKCVPAPAGKDGDEYTCERFTWQPDAGSEAAIPALANWAYVFKAAG